MKQLWKKLMAALLCLAMILPMMGSVSAEDAVYGVATADKVYVRKKAGKDNPWWFQVNKGHVAEITGQKRVGQVLWYKVNTAHPTSDNGRTYVGYIMSDYFRKMTAAETAAYLAGLGTPDEPNVPADDPTLKPSTDDSLNGYDGQTVVGGKGVVLEKAIFRSKPTKESDSLGSILAGTEVSITGIPEDDVNGWYRVEYQGETGYVLASLIELSDVGAAPTPDPGYGTEVQGSIGQVTADKVYFREGPGRQYASYGFLNKGDKVDILTIPDGIGVNHWYRVKSGNTVGYVRSDFLKVITTGTTEPPVIPDEDDGVEVPATGIIIADEVNLRAGAGIGHASKEKLNTGDIVDLLTIPTMVDENHWYKVKYNKLTGYIQAPYIRVLTVDETDLPAPEKYGYAKLMVDSAKLRDVAGGDTQATWTKKGTLLRITGEKVSRGMYDWYPVYYSDHYSIYYVQADQIQVLLPRDGELVTPTPAPQSTYGYVITTKTDVNLRIQPADKNILAKVPKNTVLTCVGPAKSPSASGTAYTWYCVKYNGHTGYLRGDCVRVCAADGGSLVNPDTGNSDPTPMPTDGSVIYGYVRLVKDKVYLRQEPQGNALGSKLPIDLILPMIGPVVPEGKYGKYCWYQVKTADGRKGYVRGDCATPSEAPDDEDLGEQETPAPEYTDTPVTDVQAKVTGNAKFLDAPSYDGSQLSVIPADTVIEVVGVPKDQENGWYRVMYNGTEGFVHASLIKVLSTDGEDPDEPAPTSYGYVMINAEKVAFRNDVDGSKVYSRLANGTVWPMFGVSVKKGNVLWHPIVVNGKKGYVHGDYSFKLSPTQEESYLAGNGVPEETPPPADVASNFVITTYNDVNLRDSYSKESARRFQVDKGVVMAYSSTKPVGTKTWYCVVYSNEEVWVDGDYIRVMTLAEYQDWLKDHPDQAPEVEASIGYLKLVVDNVFIRNAANGSTRIDKLKINTVIPYYSEPIEAGNYLWYRVKTPAGEMGYIRADMVNRCEADGGPLPTPKPELGSYSVAPASQQETSYTTLKLGASGYRVTNMVNELINQGYYKGKVTSSFTSAVKTALQTFQTVRGLTANGVANSTTLHTLFGTKAIGKGDTDNLDFAIYPVEKIDWYTGGIQEMLPRGANFKIYDVKTGIVWWAHRQAGGRHMDIETLTAADSSRLCKIYGVSNLQQIVDKNMWQRRPCLVTIGTRTFAASLDGMQHGSDTIANNKMDGQVCLHFTNSEGHASQAVSTSHKEAIEYAYNHCPAGKK